MLDPTKGQTVRMFICRCGFELGPDSGEDEQGPVVVQGEPHDILLAGRGIGLRRIFGEAVGRDQTSVLRLEPHAPVRRRRVANVRHGGPVARVWR
jgi:hypothetical protein